MTLNAGMLTLTSMLALSAQSAPSTRRSTGSWNRQPPRTPADMMTTPSAR